MPESEWETIIGLDFSQDYFINPAYLIDCITYTINTVYDESLLKFKAYADIEYELRKMVYLSDLADKINKTCVEDPLHV